ncbi:MAG: pyridoxine 5'-phosphate synthase [Deltaproteobacteria bacterium RIFCSPLOWO2_12_FULL_43_16]|nr:MAG: pyridoxine 5'-phosphate synthase [Deltaproteobacteria bacterium GWA2_43_19]OGQ09934.1 MAG: pyridoxine 5'-phosphate synthase [Deltaproteobacteria bacterium RIFCSPHIGHO2_02_FULL_43_33]OGQ44571.1 MAG: pyridoxine 5'-phosphate synthase [Deltaproteobacteria bacterium RIFCSPLOWO2_01_FULL_42_9]OGQ58459.1 MAG: pyridoxine 5'-phosphate synthase [Deltaproteobacteria bacterium RIFCSPLOWO2_12_FULL_43_16]HBR16736.1 pyridoxine 5'-phosphate synthase [Deltaproteobacteria bacterium]
MARLSVNVDHIATIRQARRTKEPDPVTAASLAEIGGADAITIHLREDRRHIQDRDAIILRKTIKTKLNLEMAATQEMLKIALELKPDMVTLVPEKRQELTTEGGLDVRTHKDHLKKFLGTLKEAGIRVNLFIDPEPEQIKASHKIDTNGIEIHTGKYCDAKDEIMKDKELERIYNTALLASKLGMAVHAGHGLDYYNVKKVTEIKEIEEFAVGFSIIARSVFVGIERAVREMKELMK